MKTNTKKNIGVRKMDKSHTKLIRRGDRLECSQCGYAWKPRKSHPVQCAKCRRNVIYDPEPMEPEQQTNHDIKLENELEPGHLETTGEGENELELETDPELENTNLIRNSKTTGEGENELELEPENLENKINENSQGDGLELELEKPMHPESEAEIKENEVHKETGLTFKELNNLDLYNKSEDLKDGKTRAQGNTENEKDGFKLDITPDQVGGLMGAMFEEDEKAEAATKSIVEVLEKHGDKLEKYIGAFLLEKGLGKAAKAGDSMIIDLVTGFGKVIGMKLFENKAKHERERVKEEARKRRERRKNKTNAEPMENGQKTVKVKRKKPVNDDLPGIKIINHKDPDQYPTGGTINLEEDREEETEDEITGISIIPGLKEDDDPREYKTTDPTPEPEPVAPVETPTPENKKQIASLADLGL